MYPIFNNWVTSSILILVLEAVAELELHRIDVRAAAASLCGMLGFVIAAVHTSSSGVRSHLRVRVEQPQGEEEEVNDLDGYRFSLLFVVLLHLATFILPFCGWNSLTSFDMCTITVMSRIIF